MAGSAEHQEATTEEVERLLQRLLAAVVALVLATGIAAVVSRSDDGSGDADVGGRDPGVAAVAGAGAVGPLPGSAIDGYLAARAQALAAAEGRRAAVVSFTEYRTVDDARSALAGLDTAGFLVAAPGGSPAVVDDVARWAEDQREEAAAELAEINRLLPTVEDPDFLRQYREDARRLERLARGVAADAPLVFGALVVGDGERLEALARTPGVRLVDVAPTGEFPPRDRVAGIRPEETARAGDPPTRPF